MQSLDRELAEDRLKRFRRLLMLSREGSKPIGNIPPLRNIRNHIVREGGNLQGPLVVMIDLTSQCNHNCVFCYRSGPDRLMPEKRAKYQSLETIDSICRQLVEMNVASITLTGGEPACHPWFIEAVALVKRYDLALTIVTNGTNFTEEKVRRLGNLLEPERDKVELSLDAATKGTFQKIARVDEFSSLFFTLKWFKRYQIPFLTMTLILKDNLDQIDKIIALATEYGARECAVEPPFPKKHMPTEAYASLDEVLDVHERLLLQKEMTPKIVLNFLHLSMNLTGGLQEFVSFYEQDGKPFSSCHGGEASCAIDINGHVHLCQFLIDLETCRVGNIFETPLTVLWKRLRKLKNALECKTTDCCAGGCPGFALEAGLPD